MRNSKSEAEEKLKRSNGRGCHGSRAWWLGRPIVSLATRVYATQRFVYSIGFGLTKKKGQLLGLYLVIIVAE
ncbi:hypothetical protein E2542_SST05717 [Spatholobus suberectus]|nr:hypothetical protein E2542_SST05717 [Spatholobus suberectus]